jgi:hypothetical protein
MPLRDSNLTGGLVGRINRRVIVSQPQTQSLVTKIQGFFPPPVATGPNGAKAIVTTTVKLYELSPSNPAALYSKDNANLSGSAINN